MKVLRHMNKFRILAAWALLIAFSGIYVCDLICTISPERHQVCLDGEMEGEAMPHHQGTQSSPDHSSDPDPLVCEYPIDHLITCNPQLCTPTFLAANFKHDAEHIKYVLSYTVLTSFQQSLEYLVLPPKQQYSHLWLPPKIPDVRIFIQSFLN